MDPPPYEPISGSSSSSGLAPGYGPCSSSTGKDRKGKRAELLDGEIRRWPNLSSSSLALDLPLHAILVKDLDPNKDSLRIGLVEDDIYVSPGELAVAVPGVQQTGTEGTGRLNGYIQIMVTSPRDIRSVTVRLVRRLSLLFPSGLETDDIVEKELVFEGDEPIHLPRGISIFEFRFLIPANSAVQQRWSATKLRHHVVASADGSATGWFGSDLREEHPMWVHDAPIRGELDSQRLQIHSQGMTDALGPFSYDLTASALLVSSAVTVSLKLHSPPPTLTVYGVKVYVVQEAHLTSHRTPGKTTMLKRPKQFIANAGPTGPYDSTFVKLHGKAALMYGKTAAGEPWAFEQIGRVPSEDHVRATTHPATETNIRLSSKLFVDIVYTTSDLSHPDSADSRKVWVAAILSKPVSIGSCACFDDRLALPDYKERQGADFQLSRSVAEMFDICLCKIPWETVKANELRANALASARALTSSSTSSSASDLTSTTKPNGRKLAETFPGDLDVVEGIVWDSLDLPSSSEDDA